MNKNLIKEIQELYRNREITYIEKEILLNCEIFKI